MLAGEGVNGMVVTGRMLLVGGFVELRGQHNTSHGEVLHKLSGRRDWELEAGEAGEGTATVNRKKVFAT